MHTNNQKNPQFQKKEEKTSNLPPIEDIRDILKGDSEKMISIAECFAKKNLKNKSTSSIRKIYSEVKGMREYNKYNLDLLRAKLAYVSKRHNELEPLTELLDATIKELKVDSFKYFKDFFEAILAYFYKHGKE
jgi:CRISPR type III-A-associated protein Csm2